ncbi:type 2 lantipeptide synthetase LanM [Bacillus cereus]|uniref:type 2 lanthipeptide synthetase LanM n=2 Tax=Bacillus cereus TaxID=1396 RepID=UPI000BEB9EDF|nr:type 2 lantipeptide synthetase LanM [Bacillus cereus]PET49681.1 type 2 lantipeptide synthetase LanM [Bacillus cereus]PEV84989.1 type 2 lantipeptide synthetase LanM [Bacillus cereus]PFA53790.1 type 2 lantipeptide synthetase LanM [Bacillus cereus]PFD64311.1 type 2 lantipeptide synthetase LanM [Bacillus cereus]
MSSLRNLLFSFERKQGKKNSNYSSIFEKNMDLIYKNDQKLLEKSIQNILSIDNVEAMKSLYKHFFIKSPYTIDTFQHIQKKMSEQPVDITRKNQCIFSSFLYKISSYWKEKIVQSKGYQKTKHKIQDESYFWEYMEQQFQKQIYRLSYRTLVFDFHINKQANRLQGDTDEQKLQNYSDAVLRDTTYVSRFFEMYPCLLRILSNEMRKNRKYIIELLRRYQADQEEISNFFFNKSGSQKIRRIDMGMGDSHCDGRKTAQLQLEEGMLLYKPRYAGPESLYTALMKEWNANIDSEIYHIKTPSGILKKQYSWIEYISYQACTKQGEIQRFYKRIGVQMAFLYACNATDFHFENIIAHKDFPVFIDVECLFHIPSGMSYKLNELQNVHKKIQHIIATSVYSLGILPVSLGDNHVDISGLGKSSNSQSVGKVPQFKNDTMKIERDYVEGGDSGKHRPGINENEVSAYVYTNDIMHGFERAYTYIQHHKKDIIQILDAYKDTLVVRYVPKSTRAYCSLLDLSVHPRFLHNSLDRELFLARFCEERDISCEGFGKSEFIDLTNGDIPYFTNQIAKTYVMTSRGKKIDDYFSISPYQFVKQKIEDFSDQDLTFQLQIIESSLVLKKEQEKDSVYNIVPIDPTQYDNEFEQQDYFLQIAKEIADYLYTLAFTEEREEKRKISWLNMLRSQKKFELQAMDDSLYSGLSGMALMYLSLWVVTKEKKYLKIAEDIMDDIVDRMNGLSIDDSIMMIGAFNGVSSVLYTLLNFYQLTQKSRYKECAKQAVQIIENRLYDDINLDVIGGTAGALIVLIRYYELEQEQEVLDTAKLCGEFLIQKAIDLNDQEIGWISPVSEKPLTGFSHGNAGFLYALHLLNQHIQSKEIYTVTKKGMRFENNNKTNDQWLDLRTNQHRINQQTDACRWCHGSPGILISRLALQNSEDEWIASQSQKDIEYAFSNMLQFGLESVGTGKSLCHGLIGNALILMKYGQEMQDLSWKNIAQNIMYESIKHLKIDQLKQPIDGDVDGLGLLSGLAGIAYGLLYACDQRLPNIMTVELGQLVSNEIEHEVANSNL